MSHVGIRILADRLADVDEGVNAVAATVPRLNSDPAPPAVVVVDSTRNGWVLRGEVPAETATIVYPMVIVSLMSATYDGGVPAANPDDSRTVTGQLQVLIQLALAGSDTSRLATDSLYLLRAIRGVLAVLDDGRNESARRGVGVALGESTSITQATTDAPVPSSGVSPGAFVVTYPFTESVPLTSAL